MNKRGFMRLPKDSTVTKELSKQFNRIFHKNTTLGEIQNLQEDFINPVDTHLENQVSKLEKANGKENVSYARTVRQTNSEGKRFVETTVQAETEEEKVSF